MAAIEGALLGGGLILLWAGALLLVRGSAGLAGRAGLPPAVAGLIFVSVAAAAPDFVIAQHAMSAGLADLAMGHLVGSNLASALLVLGIAALLAPVPSSPALILRDGTAMVLGCLAFAGLAQLGGVNAFAAIFLLLALGGYLTVAFLTEPFKPQWSGALPPRAGDTFQLLQGIALYGAMTLGGAAALFFGARALVAGAAAIGHANGWPDAFLGLSVTALAAALPELSAAVAAGLRRQGALAAGAVVGGIAINCLGVLGLLGLVQPVPVDAALAGADVWLMLGAAVLIVPLLFSGWRLSRAEGTVLAALYAVYLLTLVQRMTGQS